MFFKWMLTPHTCMYLHDDVYITVVYQIVAMLVNWMLTPTEEVPEEQVRNTLQHTATHCNTLQHTATHCNTLQHTATHCNTLQHAATCCNALSSKEEVPEEQVRNTLKHTETYCDTLQHTATHCNSLQHAHTKGKVTRGTSAHYTAT